MWLHHDPLGPLNLVRKATHPAETQFLAVAEGARLWLVEAAAAGTARIMMKDGGIPASTLSSR